MISGRVIADPERAEDVLQDSFVRLWIKQYPLQSEKEAEALLTRAVRNASLNERRRKRGVPMIMDMADESPDTEEKERAYDQLKRKIDSELTSTQKYILEEKELAQYAASTDDPAFGQLRGVLGFLSIGREMKVRKHRAVRIYAIAAAASVVLVATVGIGLYNKGRSTLEDNCIRYAYGVKVDDDASIMASVETSLADFFGEVTPAETNLKEMFER